MGEPGRPGTRDLDWSIRRVRLRKQFEKDYQEFRRRRGLFPPTTSLVQHQQGAKLSSAQVAAGNLGTPKQRFMLMNPHFHSIRSLYQPNCKLRPLTATVPSLRNFGLYPQMRAYADACGGNGIVMRALGLGFRVVSRNNYLASIYPTRLFTAIFLGETQWSY